MNAYSKTTECPIFDFLKIEDHDTTHIHVSCGKRVHASLEKNKYSHFQQYILKLYIKQGL